MPFSLPDLPYSNDALVPFISADTLTLHHGKHHAGYVSNLNRLVEGTELAGKALEEVVRVTAGRPDRTAIHQNASQAWNHEFYWHSLAHGGGGKPHGAIASRIAADFGGHERFAAQFAQAAVSQFGSGWAWLCLRGERLEIVKTPNEESPLAKGGQPLLTIDVWEHAYYLDYRNRRLEYVHAVIDHLLDWEFANANLARA
jgi:superoxide dismutase, Fe-Mn family